ncbi:hypothetical protein L6452_00408 [Arctium lappa]|uniref:Uncharacterized protein n=1 Tax=Arctium lappa TaxID=4217 RepID=A0ACB9FDS3_ARCLA|nr:hypothetical protein L6452_00408 [Arctium lappa]
MERQMDGNKDAKLEECPRFQKRAEMQQSMTNLGKSGGVYTPPFNLARMMNEVQDSTEYQKMTWVALRKSINGLINKVNATNIKNIIPELFAENLIRGRGLFFRSCMKSQMAFPGFTDVFAALVAVVNTKFPEVGDLLLRRTILQLQRAYKRNDKPQLFVAFKFVAHLVNQQIVHELIALELLISLVKMLYGLIHVRYILTTKGLGAMMPESLLLWASLSSFWPVEHFSPEQCSFQVPFEVNVILIGFSGDGGYRYTLDSQKLQEFLQVGFPSHMPSCLETDKPLDIEHHMVFNAIPIVYEMCGNYYLVTSTTAL